jgi:hypothetical protein
VNHRSNPHVNAHERAGSCEPALRCGPVSVRAMQAVCLGTAGRICECPPGFDVVRPTPPANLALRSGHRATWDATCWHPAHITHPVSLLRERRAAWVSPSRRFGAVPYKPTGPCQSVVRQNGVRGIKRASLRMRGPVLAGHGFSRLAWSFRGAHARPGCPAPGN